MSQTPVAEMNPAELRELLEQLECTLTIHRGRLRLDDPRGALWKDPQLSLRFRQLLGQLTALVTAYPCRGCGLDPFVIPTKCARCRGAQAHPRPTSVRDGGRR